MAADAVALQGPPRTNRLAVAALVAAVAGPVLGLLLWFTAPLLGGVAVLLGWSLALAFGFSALGQIRMASGAEGGDGLAHTGITLGFIELGALVLVMLVAITIASPFAGVIVTGIAVALLLALLFGNTRLVGRYVITTVLALVVIFPIYITVVNSLLRPEQIAGQPTPSSFFPIHPQWDSYGDAWSAGHMATYLRNSFIVTILITVGQIVTAVLAGYAFAFLQFPLKRTLFVVFLSTLMVPFEVTIITNLETVDSLGWLNSYQGLAVPFLATGFGAFLLRQAFLQVPATSRTPLPWTATATCGSWFGSRCRSPVPPSPHWRCSDSCRPGTSTCGRCSSPRTISTEPSRSASSSCVAPSSMTST